MTDLKNKKVLLHDYGPYSFLAQKLSESFGTTFYYTPWKGSLPRPERAMIGEGLDGVTNVKDFWKAVKKLNPKEDLICFFDVGEGDLQIHLREMGYNVFGMGNAEELEMDRNVFKKTLSNLGLPVIPYKHIVGISALNEYLHEVKDKYVKITSYRWLTETFHHVDYDHSKSRLRMLEYNAGAYQNKIEFIVEDPIKGIEAGTDNFISDSGYYDICLMGYEDKGKGYLCKVMDTQELPKPLKQVLYKSIPYYKKNKPRGMFSTEVRCSPDGKPYWVDATMRGGMPPTEIICELYKNFNEVIYAIAMGQKIELDPIAPYAAQVELSSKWAEKEATVISFPENISRYIKLQNLCKIDGNYKYIPQEKWDIVGAAIGFGNSPEEAGNNALENAKQITADSLEYSESTFINLNDAIKKAETHGLGKF